MPGNYETLNVKKFLDAQGLSHFSQNYVSNDVLEAVVDGVQDALDEKVNSSSVGAVNGVASLDGTGKVPASQLPDLGATYTLTQDANNGHILHFNGTDGSSADITIPDNDTTYGEATTTASGLLSATDKVQLNNLSTNLANKLDSSLKGASSGLAELDEYGKVPTTQLPSYVDDVLEYADRDALPSTGESGKIYVCLDTNLTYRWSGTTYVEISPSLALGETNLTAHRGDHGAAAYAHAVANKGSAFTSGLYKITTNSEGHVTEATAVTKPDITGLGIPESDTTYETEGTYDAANNKLATESTVQDAINALDGGTIGAPGAGKTISSLSQADGNISASFQDISITMSQVNDLPLLGVAAQKGVTDNTEPTEVSSSDQNLITGRTLYNAGYTKNVGTITGITLNNELKGTEGIVDLGSVLTAHQDISGKADKSETVSTVQYDSNNKKLTKTIGIITSDIVGVADLKSDMNFGQAADKDVDNTIGNASTSVNVPTSQAVASFVEGKNYLTSHQDISGKADRATTVTNVSYDSVNDKFTKTINGTTSDIVTASSLKDAMNLSNVDNTRDLNKPVSTATQNALDAKLDASLKGVPDGIAELDASGRVPSAQLPSYVDDVVEYDDALHFPETGEAGKIYVDKDANLAYRWSGSDYIEISPSIALGETSSTAYRGDRGAAAYAHAVTNKGYEFSTGFYKITTNSEGHVIDATPVTKADLISLGVVTSINGRNPNTSTGDIEVQESTPSGLASTHIYRQISTSDWTINDGVYQITITDSTISANMYCAEMWLDDESVLTGSDFSGDIVSGTITLSCDTLPTSTVGFHALLVADGAQIYSGSGGSGGASYSVATQSTDGLMSAADKTKLDGIDEGANRTFVVHDLNYTSMDSSALGASQGSKLNNRIVNISESLATYVEAGNGINTITSAVPKGSYFIREGTIYLALKDLSKNTVIWPGGLYKNVEEAPPIIDLINENKTDISELRDQIGIVCNYRKAPTSIAEGQYVIIKNSSLDEVPDGLYTAAQAIPDETYITAEYVTSVPNGGLNDLKAKIGDVGSNDLQSQITSLSNSIPYMELKSITGTTSGNGNLPLREYVGSSIILSAWTTDNNATVCIPYIISDSSQWGVHVRHDDSTGAIYASTNFTINFVVVPTLKLH